MMSDYRLTWITEDLATGHAPMSYDDLDFIRSQGVDAIVNLCGEFCDLHEIEEKSGFEVYYLPIFDECAPDMPEMEKALAWLDEAIYLGKKVLIHCRHGIGRTGTFVTSYLLRKGLGLKLASKRLKKTPAQPSNYCQWKLLKKYGKKEGVLKIREPSLESRSVVDLGVFFSEYASLLEEIEEKIEALPEENRTGRCGQDTSACCRDYHELQLIEAIYLTSGMNRKLDSNSRLTVIERAVVAHQKTLLLKQTWEDDPEKPQTRQPWTNRYAEERILCPLNENERCMLYNHRPLACRLHGLPESLVDVKEIRTALSRLSRNVFLAFSGSFLETGTLTFSIAETVSGKYIQSYFYHLASMAEKDRQV